MIVLPPNTCVQLFDKLIQPISLYGSEVWAPFCLNSCYTNITNKDSLFGKFTDFPGFSSQINFDERLLKVNEKALILILQSCENSFLPLSQIGVRGIVVTCDVRLSVGASVGGSGPSSNWFPSISGRTPWLI
jgi:hypothetical protein